MGFSLFIDESNYGRYPEFIVAVKFHGPGDITKGSFKKVHDRSRSALDMDIESITQGRKFRQVVVGSEYNNRNLKKPLIKEAAVIAFARYFGTDGLDRVVVDGHLLTPSRENIAREVFDNDTSRIEGIVDADITFLPANIADRLAFTFFRRWEQIAEGYTKKNRWRATEEYMRLYSDTILPLGLAVPTN
jgi:hypothetical protein